ncbi:MAG: histidine--tRNA ligase, partial [Calditrichaeota bacterium]
LDRNALRLLDCKKEQCQPLIAAAPAINDHLCSDCEDHFSRLKGYLELTGRRFQVNHRLVRGLDYYTKTVFEVWAQGIGAQNAMCGGGRYDGLIEQLGGESTPGIGFGSGIERIIMSMQEQGLPVSDIPAPAVFLAPQGEKARRQAAALAMSLRENKIGVLLSFGEKSFKSMMRDANRRQMTHVVLIGDEELAQEMVMVKELNSGAQIHVATAELVSFFSGSRQRE